MDERKKNFESLPESVKIETKAHTRKENTYLHFCVLRCCIFASLASGGYIFLD